MTTKKIFSLILALLMLLGTIQGTSAFGPEANYAIGESLSSTAPDSPGTVHLAQGGTPGTKYDFHISGTFYHDMAYEVLSQLNTLRSSLGKEPLVMDEALLETAMQRAAETAIFWNHYRPDGTSPFTIFPDRDKPNTFRGENIAVGQYNATVVMNSWKDSAGHYNTMTSDNYTAVGIACFRQGNGDRYWVQVFTGGRDATPVERSGQETGVRPITANASVLTLSLTPAAATMTAGGTQVFSLYNQKNKEWAWADPVKIIPSYYTTDNPSVATVNASGLVTAVGGGSTTLRLGVGSDFYEEAGLTVSATPISAEQFTVDTSSAEYTGSAITRQVSSTLVLGTDYTVSYANNVNVGTATLTITGTGAYSGTLPYQFTITQAALTLDGSPTLAELPANDAANTDIANLVAAVQAASPTVSASYGAGTATLDATWSCQSGNFDPKGGAYTLVAALTPTDPDNFTYAGGYATATLTVTPVTGTYAYTPPTLTKTMTSIDAASSMSELGLPTSITVSYDNGGGSADYPITDWSHTLAQLQDIDASGSNETHTLIPTVTFPEWATIDTDGLKTVLTITNAEPDAVNVSVSAPTDITYGDALGDPSATQTAIDNGIDGDASWEYLYVGTTRGGVAYQSYDKPTRAGEYHVTATLVSATHIGSGDSAPFTIAPKMLEESMINVTGSYQFTGSAIVPSYTVADGALLKAGDYEVAVSNNVNAGTGTVTVTAKGTGNYDGNAVRGFSIAKAAAPVIDPLAQTYGADAATTGVSIDLAALLPSDCGTAGYVFSASGDPVVTDIAVSAAGQLTFDTATGSDGDQGVLSITVTMQNYESVTITVTVALVGKTTPVGTPLVSGSLFYGQPLSALPISVAMTDGFDTPVGGTIVWAHPSSIPAVGAPAQAWVFTPDDDSTYAGVSGSAPIVVNKAVALAVPSFSKITTDGKTLADTNLSATFVNPYTNDTVPGNLTWDSGDATAVTANQSYGWTFTPDETANYEVVTGTITPYPRGGGGGGGGSTQNGSVSVITEGNGSVTVDTEKPSAGSKVTLVPTPDSGYELERLTVTDAQGNELAVSANSDGTFSFVHPGTAVSINAVFVPEGTGAGGAELPFTDVAPTDWFYPAIAYACENGIMNGTGAGTIEPNTVLTRSMMVQILYNYEGRPAAGGPGLADVDDGMWYADAAKWSAAQGIVSGVGNHLFAPDQPITREQMAVMLYRYCVYKGITLPAVRTSPSFGDGNSISSWALDAANAMYMAGILTGKGDGTFDPQGEATRAEVAQMMMNFLEAIR